MYDAPPMTRQRSHGGFVRACIAAALLLAAAPARANVAEPEGRAEDAFDFMNLLARHHLHDLDDETWNAYGQLTWISNFKLPFSAPYTNLNGSPNSLSPDFEHSFTGTATLWLGARFWRGGEFYFVPEAISERPLSGLTGLGGVIQNFELQKQGSETPIVYIARLYFRQTIGLGGHPEVKTSDPMQLGTVVDSRRLVFTIGNFSILDFFDKNAFAGDLRRQFFNMAFLTYAAYDFAADARGYTWGAAAELYLDDWALRFGHFLTPLNPNQLPLDFRFWQYFGEQIEIEHAHSLRGLPGAVRILAYLNRENMGRFDEAVVAFQSDPAKNATTCAGFHYASQNAMAPDLCWARRPNIKLGIGLNLEQYIFRDIGVFFRGMYSDGKTEVYSFTSTDMSIAFGALARGSLWRRPKDYAGAGYAMGWISQSHADYLRLGGIDGFIGDGRLTQSAESVFEFFYGLNLLSSVWLSGDYQYINHPGYNSDRGPVNILGVRLHAEF
jgi:hypothetical protein